MTCHDYPYAAGEFTALALSSNNISVLDSDSSTTTGSEKKGLTVDAGDLRIVSFLEQVKDFFLGACVPHTTMSTPAQAREG